MFSIEKGSAKADPFEVKIRRRPTFPHSCPCSIIGATELNFCVRDGNRCCLCAIATEKRLTFNKHFWQLLRRLHDTCCCYSLQGNACLFPKIFSGFGAKLPSPRCTVKTFYGQASRSISTGKLNTLLCLHTRPINVVVSNGPLGNLRSREILS